MPRVPSLCLSLDLTGAADAQRVGDAIDVVEPGRDERDLQDAAIVEADGAQALVVARLRLRVASLVSLHDVVEHHAILLGDRRGSVVVLQGLDQLFIQRDATQKLCVRLDSILAAVGDRDHRRDHLVLAARERQVGRHQHAEGREGVVERVGDQGSATAMIPAASPAPSTLATGVAYSTG